MFSIKSNKHGFTSIQAEYIHEIDKFIRYNIDPILKLKKIILSKEVIPPETNNKFPSSTFGTGYISSDGKYAVKIINFEKYVKQNIHINMSRIQESHYRITELFYRNTESLYNELINYNAISDECPEHFCKLIGYNYDYDDHILTIVMENCGKDLYDMYRFQDKKPKDNVIRDHIYQLLKILNCLHENNFVHFDLKLENIVMDNNGILKLIDAGSLIEIDDHRFPEVFVRGSKEYMAPELKNRTKIVNNELLKETDIYSLGIILIIFILDVEYGFEKIYNITNYDSNDIFEYWNSQNYDNNASKKIIHYNFKKYFGDDIRFEHFFSNTESERLTIQELLSMFKKKMEADKIKDIKINSISYAKSARTGKKGGKKTRQKRNNKSKRRQHKSRNK
jgi:serine/threonine protein kinase